jgi:hypothetical protein
VPTEKLHELLKNTFQIAAELVRMAMHHKKRRSIPHVERKSWRREEERQKPIVRVRWKFNPKNLIIVKRVNLYILFQPEIETNSHKNTNLQKERERRMKKMNNCRSFLFPGNSEIQQLSKLCLLSYIPFLHTTSAECHPMDQKLQI